MGLRHLVVVDGDHKVTGMITRHDITEHKLEHHWFAEGDNLQKFINVGPMESFASENVSLLKSLPNEIESYNRPFEDSPQKHSKVSSSNLSNSPPQTFNSEINSNEFNASQAPEITFVTSERTIRESKVMREPKSSKSIV